MKQNWMQFLIAELINTSLRISERGISRTFAALLSELKASFESYYIKKKKKPEKILKSETLPILRNGEKCMKNKNYSMPDGFGSLYLIHKKLQKLL